MEKGVQCSLKPVPRPTQGAATGTNGNGAKAGLEKRLRYMNKTLAQETTYLQCRSKAYPRDRARDRSGD